MAKLLDSNGLTRFWNAFKSRLLPSGGSSGQMLTKASGTNYDTEWTTPSKVYFNISGSEETAESIVINADSPLALDYSGLGSDVLNVTLQMDDSVFGQRYTANSSHKIDATGIDTLTNGPHLDLPAGEYIIVGVWNFNTGASTGSRNIQVALRNGASGSAWGEKNRVVSASNAFAILSITMHQIFSSDTTVYLCGSSSMKTSSTSTCYISAIRIK